MNFSKQELTEIICDAMVMASKIIEDQKKERIRGEVAYRVENRMRVARDKSEESILNALRNAVDPLSHGVVRNKLRGMSTEQANDIIESMVDVGDIIKTESLHPKNGSIVIHYHLPK